MKRDLRKTRFIWEVNDSGSEKLQKIWYIALTGVPNLQAHFLPKQIRTDKKEHYE